MTTQAHVDLLNIITNEYLDTLTSDERVITTAKWRNNNEGTPLLAQVNSGFIIIRTGDKQPLFLESYDDAVVVIRKLDISKFYLADPEIRTAIVQKLIALAALDD